MDQHSRISWKPFHSLPSLLIAALAVALLVRLVVLSAYKVDTGLPWASIFDGHDGAEYVSFAQSLRAGDIAGIPFDARRHDAGYALFLALFVPGKIGAITSYIATLGALLLSVVLYCFLVQRTGLATMREAAALAMALTIVYPSQVYFSAFVLSEPVFLLLLIGATLLLLKDRPITACIVVGFAALVRAPGVFLAPALVLADYVSRRGGDWNWRRDAGLPLAALPWLVWAGLTGYYWNETPITLYRPEIGLPFSGFVGMSEVGMVRSLYVILAVAFFVISALRLFLQARRNHWRSPFLNTAAFFCAIFLLFHLCIKTLHYIDHTVYTFTYQDRYYVGLLPFALFAWRDRLRWWTIAPAVALSVALSVYWGHNYFIARALG